MPLASFAFSINAHDFSYIDYIDPFLNIITPFSIEKSARTTGGSKPSLILEIKRAFDTEIDEAKDMFKSTIKQLNTYISENKELRTQFPTFNDLLMKFYKHGFINQCEFHLNFVQKKPDIERHIRHKTIRDAMNSLEYYIEFNETNEEYTFESVKRECEEYNGLSLEHNNTDHFRDKTYILTLEAFEKKERVRFFESLRDIMCALPLDGFFKPSEEDFN